MGQQHPLSPQTRLSITIATAGSVLVFAVGATWQISNRLRDIDEGITTIRNELSSELNALKRDLAAQEGRAWNKYDMRNWSFDLERKNRAIPLDVPDPRNIRP